MVREAEGLIMELWLYEKSSNRLLGQKALGFSHWLKTFSMIIHQG